MKEGTTMENEVKVSKDRFYEAMHDLDVHPCIENDLYPYRTTWRLRRGGSHQGGTAVGRNFDDGYFLFPDALEKIGRRVPDA